MKNNDIKFETLKKPIRKKIIIGCLVAIAIVSAITLTTSRAKYRLTQSIPVVRGKIYYYNGDLNVMAVKTSEDGTNYNDSDTIPTSGYTFNTTKSVCKVPLNDTYIEDKSIPMEYKDGKVYIGISKKKTKCYLYFDKVKTASETLLSYAKSKSNGEKSSFSSVATTNEGIFQASDGMYGGTSYYWRGAVTDNHVIFANYCWRIIRINGDGTIRMIYNGTVQSGNTCLGNGANTTNVEIGKSAYNTDVNQSYYAGWTYTTGQRPSTSVNNGTVGTSTTIKEVVDNWYSANIGNNSTYNKLVASGKYCNDRNIDSAPSNWGSGYVTTWSANETRFAYAAAKRIYDNFNPTLSCSNNGDIYEVKVGLITADEAMYAGGNGGAANRSYWLRTNSWYWTISPNAWYGPASVFFVNSDGILSSGFVNDAGGVRPVINLSTSVTFNTNSDGSSLKPYIVQ